MNTFLVHTVFSNVSIYMYCFLGKICFWKGIFFKTFLLFFKIFSVTFLRENPLLPLYSQHPKHFLLYHCTCWVSSEFLGLKVSWKGFATCHKATYSPNTALKCLADQWTSRVKDSVDNDFSLNQHPNEILGRRGCYQRDIKGALGAIATLNCFSTKCFTFLVWKSFVWKISCVFFKKKKKGQVGLQSSEVF